MTIKRGEIYYADLSPVVGSEQGGVRPVLIVQNNVGNKYSPTVIAAAITSINGDEIIIAISESITSKILFIARYMRPVSPLLQRYTGTFII